MQFLVNDLLIKDLDNIAWSGNPKHPLYVKEMLLRREKGEIEYLAVRDDNGNPISIGCVDYKAHEGAGTLCQLVTKEPLRGQGLGSQLIQALENKIKERGLSIAILAVEDTNSKARALYERLGYEVYGNDTDSYEYEDKEGNTRIHTYPVFLMKKSLS